MMPLENYVPPAKVVQEDEFDFLRVIILTESGDEHIGGVWNPDPDSGCQSAEEQIEEWMKGESRLELFEDPENEDMRTYLGAALGPGATVTYEVSE
jgi:hypothetical protein